MTSPASSSDPAIRKQDGSTYRKNPQPKQAYRITMRIENAPGPFASMTALAQYDVVNKECLRPPKENPGGHTSSVPTADVEIPLQKVADNTYSGVIYADRMLDEDYNGRGICHWQLMQFRAHMKATGAEGETQFIPSILGDKIVSGTPESIYLSRAPYPRDEEIEDLPVFGRSDRSKMAIRDEDLFTVEFTPSKEAMP